MNNGNVNWNNKSNNKNIRPVVAVPPSATSRIVYDIPFSTLVDAWIECERNKRSSNSCVKFRWHSARELADLWFQIREGRYKPQKSTCFMVSDPVLREVWAGSFRDRIVHHWEYLRFGPILEKYFVAVGDCSMNCRKGYGSLRAVKKMMGNIQRFTKGYSIDNCYIVGGDFANFFMSIDKDLLWGYLEHIIMDEYEGSDKSVLLYMMRQTLYHRCQDDYYLCSDRRLWERLPLRKSLFHMDGLPIGNLPSQIWANFIGAVFTQWINYEKKINGFLIFVDDWRCLIGSKEEGRRLINEIKHYLDKELHITLHPNKIYLQHYTKGTKMVGAIVKTDRIYITNRIRGNFISTIIRYNKLGQTHTERLKLLDKLRASINSYLGLMCHFKTYKIRKKICVKYILPTWGDYLFFEGGFTKCILKKQYDRYYVLRKRLKNSRFAARFIRPV